MKTTRFRTVSLLHLCIMCGFIWSLTTSFETFDPIECMDLLEDRTVFGKSYLDCVDSCKNTVECIGVSYQRRSLRCRNHFANGVMKKCPCYVLSMKSVWKHKDGKCMCPTRKICNQSGECVFSGCTKLQGPTHGKLYGNMLGLCAKVIFQCNPGYIMNQPGALVCKEDGQWSGEIPACIEAETYMISVNVFYVVRNKVSAGSDNRQKSYTLILIEKIGHFGDVFRHGGAKLDDFYNGGLPYTDPDCTRSLVDKVGDDQLSQSSYWCDNKPDCRGTPDGMTAKYARLNSTGFITGSWSAGRYGNLEFIQVDFREQSVISGILLKGRDYFAGHPQQYVTKFRLLVSSNCTTFVSIKDDSGGDKIFDGNTQPEEPDSSETVYRPLAERVMARCVRINPTRFESYISLRFDVLGC